MVALTYYAHRGKLRQLGRESELEAMNRQACGWPGRWRRKAAPWWPATCVTRGPTTRTTRQRRCGARHVCRAAQLGRRQGIDFVIAETNDYLGEALIAGGSQELGLPAMVRWPHASDES